MIFLQTLGLHVFPVISSILDCNGCETSDLSEHVTIFFDLKQSPSQTVNVAKCVFAIDNPHMYESYTDWFLSYRRGVGANFWNDSGCSAIHFENGSVMCSCNHLTHFGVLFDTGGEPVSDFVH